MRGLIDAHVPWTEPNLFTLRGRSNRLLTSFGRRNPSKAERASILHLKTGLALRRLQLALLYDACKAGFRADQPRWPKGSGEVSGRWSGGAGSGGVGIRAVAAAAAAAAAFPKIVRGGHHLIPKKYINDPNLSFSDAAKKVFLSSVTGPLPTKVHRYDQDHRAYSRAIGEHIPQFLKERGLHGPTMTTQEAEELVKSVRRHSDVRINQYNSRLYMARFNFIMRRWGARRGE